MHIVKPTVAVWMVTYNHADFIEQAIESVMMQQTDFEYHLFIGEDCSTDNTREICKKLKTKYSNKITLILNETNLGGRENACNVYRKCIESEAKYIALLEGDDFWTNTQKLQKQVGFLEANPMHSFCWTRFQTLDQKTQELTLDFNDKHFPKNEKEIDFDFEKSLKGWHMGTQTLLLRSVFFDLERLNKFKYFRDVHIITQLLKKGKGACLNFVGAAYRVHDEGMHTSVTEYEGYKIGYNCNKEIYNDNKQNVFVKKKYMLAFQNFININIQQNYLFKAFWMSLKLFFIQGSMLSVLRNFKRILTKGLKRNT